MLPPAPVRFSTMTGLLIRSERRCASMRATTSPPPPAANGTMNLIGLLGYFCCAATGPAAAAMPSASVPFMKARLSTFFSAVLSWRQYARRPLLVDQLQDQHGPRER